MRFIVALLLLAIAATAQAKPFTITQAHCDDLVKGTERLGQLQAQKARIDDAWRANAEPLVLTEPGAVRWDTLPLLNYIAAELFHDGAMLKATDYVTKIKATCPANIGKRNN